MEAIIVTQVIINIIVFIALVINNNRLNKLDKDFSKVEKDCNNISEYLSINLDNIYNINKEEKDDNLKIGDEFYLASSIKSYRYKIETLNDSGYYCQLYSDANNKFTKGSPLFILKDKIKDKSFKKLT